MGPSITDTFFVVNAKSLAEARLPPGPPVDLAEPLRAAAAEVALRPRTESLALAIAQAPESDATDWMCDVWRGAQAGDRLALRCLSSLLEVRLSGVELLRAGAALRQASRWCRRSTRGPISETATEVVAALRAAAAHIGIAPGQLHEPDATTRLRRRANELLNATIANRVAPVELAWLTNLIELEMRATSILLAQLAERVGACDGRLISRLLPVLSAHEERVRDTRDLLLRLPGARELGRRTPVLLQRLEDKGYDGFVQRLAKRPDGVALSKALVLAAWRAPLGRELAFFGGLVRVVGDRLAPRSAPPVDPAHALLLALLARRDEGLAIELSPAEARSTRALWATFGLRAASGPFALAYEPARCDRYLPDDTVPELSTPASRPTPNLRQLVLASIQNEHVIAGLLQSPAIANLPGLIEQVVIRTRSLKILLDICNRRELHSGAANRNVPRLLLWHPSGVPVSALRKFVHVRFVDRVELSAMAQRGSRARPEVRQMAAQYLAQLGHS